MRMPAEAASIPRVREAVDRVLAARGWPAEDSHDVLLAVTEAVGNAVEHGSPLGAPVDVEMACTARRAVVRVTDRGRPGARLPPGAPEPPADTDPRGRGRLIMRALADRVDEHPASGGTTVVLDFCRRAM